MLQYNLMGNIVKIMDEFLKKMDSSWIIKMMTLYLSCIENENVNSK